MKYAQLEEHEIFLRIEAYWLMDCPDAGDHFTYICSPCKTAIKQKQMPAKCILNGLETMPLPDALKGLDPFSLQLVQLAKAFQTVVRLKNYSNKVPSWNSLQACRRNMFVLPLPLSKTVKTLGVGESGLPKPELYVMMDGTLTKNKVVWRSIIDISKVQKALTKLREINWLYGQVDPDSVEKSTKDLVIDVVNSATCTMVKKVQDKKEYVAELQAYTDRSINQSIPTTSDIDQYRMVSVDEFPIKGTQEYIDCMCFPDLFPTGEFGQHHPREVLGFSAYVKSRLTSKHSRFRKKAEYVFFLLHQKMNRELNSGIYNCIRNVRNRDSSVRELLAKLESNDDELEGNLPAS